MGEKRKPKPRMLNFSQNNLPLIFTDVQFAPCWIWCELVSSAVCGHGEAKSSCLLGEIAVGAVGHLGGHCVCQESSSLHPKKLLKGCLFSESQNLGWKRPPRLLSSICD